MSETILDRAHALYAETLRTIDRSREGDATPMSEALDFSGLECLALMMNFFTGPKQPYVDRKQICGRCVQAAGDTTEAAAAATRYTLTEVREHMAVCEHNPANHERDRQKLRIAALEAAVLEAARIAIELSKPFHGRSADRYSQVARLIELRALATPVDEGPKT